ASGARRSRFLLLELSRKLFELGSGDALSLFVILEFLGVVEHVTNLIQDQVVLRGALRSQQALAGIIRFLGLRRFLGLVFGGVVLAIGCSGPASSAPAVLHSAAAPLPALRALARLAALFCAT